MAEHRVEFSKSFSRRGILAAGGFSRWRDGGNCWDERLETAKLILMQSSGTTRARRHPITHLTHANSTQPAWQRAAAQALIVLEAVFVLAMIAAFWHHSPPIRDNWVWLVTLAVPIYGLRFVIHRRLWTPTAFDGLFAFFLIASLYNFSAAPLHRQDYAVLMVRPLMGILIVWFFVDAARVAGRLDGLWLASVALGLIVGGLGLTATQWIEKSSDLLFIIQRLPVLDYRRFAPDTMLSFNVNEIAGAMAWLCPLMAGLALLPDDGTRLRWLVRQGARVAFAVLLLALMLGQSRFALAGVFLGLGGIIALLIQTRRRQIIALVLLAVLIALEGALLFNLLPDNTSSSAATTADSTESRTMSERDQTTFSVRFQIWDSGLRMLADHPLTGVGMSMFRTAVQRDPYIVPHYASRDYGPPHAHNELVQIGADMGLPGVAFFLGLHGVMAYGLWRCWQSGNRQGRIGAAALAAGIIGHAVYGIGDTITLWDRFYFIFWWMLGLIAALSDQSRRLHRNR